MSASSSTINTSRAISPPVCLLFFGIVVRRVRLVARGRKQMHVECHAGDRSAAGPVQKLEVSEMLLDDLLDDGEAQPRSRSEEHTSELQSLMRISYAVFCLKKKKSQIKQYTI